MAKLKSYQAQAKIEVWVSTEIQASNLIEAAQKASALKEEDFITVDGEYLDGRIQITGAFES